MNKPLFAALLALPLVVASLACGGPSGTVPLDGPIVITGVAPPPTDGSFIDAPDLGITDWVKGDPVDLASASEVVLVEHWATWCGPCRGEMPHLTHLQDEHGSALTIVGISDESVGTVRPFVTRNDAEMGYTVAVAPPSAMRSWTAFSGADGIPYSYLVQGGKVLWHGHPAGLDSVLTTVLAGAWTPAASAAYAALPVIVETYFSTLPAGTAAARSVADPMVDNPTMGANPKNELAWRILTETPENQRDLELALLLSQQATDEMKHEDWAMEDTLGLALYLNLRVEEAIAVQARAVELCQAAGAGRDCDELNDRLVGFQAEL